jgi:hypothetical protein
VRSIRKWIPDRVGNDRKEKVWILKQVQDRRRELKTSRLEAAPAGLWLIFVGAPFPYQVRDRLGAIGGRIEKMRFPIRSGMTPLPPFDPSISSGQARRSVLSWLHCLAKAEE